jgi:hypothetical protein
MATRSSARFGSTTELGIGLSARSPRGLNNSERRYALHLRPIGDRFVDLTAYFDEAVTRGPATIIVLSAPFAILISGAYSTRLDGVQLSREPKTVPWLTTRTSQDNRSVRL